MSYVSIVQMASSQSLLNRVAAAAAVEGVDNALVWAQENIWRVAAQPGWADDWKYAQDTATSNVNPDTGAREDVINDSKILSAVQTLYSPPAAV